MSSLISLLTAIGWSLLDSIWQMALLWLIYFLLTAGNKRFTSAGKYNLALLLVFLGAEWFVYTLIGAGRDPRSVLGSGFIPVSGYAVAWVPYISVVYLLVLSARCLQQGIRFRNRKKPAFRNPASAAHQAFADRYARLLGITRKIQVHISGIAGSAQTCGFIKPLILLPVSLVTRLTPEQVESILIHELFHIRRNDYLFNLFITALKNILFFNPFMQLFYKAMVRERELACDDGVLETGYAPEIYAEALYNLEKFRQAGPGFSLAADGNRPWLLMERIRRVLGNPLPDNHRISPVLLFLGILAFLSLGLRLQTSAPDGLPQPVRVPNAHKQLRYEPPVTGIKLKPAFITVRRSCKPGLFPPPPPPHPARIAAPASDALTDRSLTSDPSKFFFAENKIIKNFSNQSSAAITRDPVLPAPGIPYIPSVSLNYETMPEILIADSLQAVALENNLNMLLTDSRVKTIAGLQVLKTEMEKNQQEIADAEKKEGHLIRLDRERIQPLIDKFHRELKLKKRQIDQLRVRLQISEEEIIHI